MDWKSTKLTNILLFIIVCFFVLAALCGLGRVALGHRGFEGKFAGCQMQGQSKNVEKGLNVGLGDQEALCPYAKQNIETKVTK